MRWGGSFDPPHFKIRGTGNIRMSFMEEPANGEKSAMEEKEQVDAESTCIVCSGNGHFIPAENMEHSVSI